MIGWPGPRPRATEKEDVKAKLLACLLAGAFSVAALAQPAAAPPAAAPAAAPAPEKSGKPQPPLEIQQTKIYRQSAEAAHGAVSFYGRLDRPAEQRRVSEIGYRLAAVSEFRDFPFSFYLVDMPVPNAFALPGGHIFVTRGMLDLGLSDDMLACLIGHEIAHVIERHGQRLQRRATLLNVLSQAALLGVMIGAEDKPSDVYNPYAGPEESRRGTMVQGTFAAGIVFTELLLRKYSREFEDEADDHGQRLAAAAGFDPIGAKQLWQTMTEKIPQAENYGYWRTHPFSEVRLRAAAARAQELGKRPPGSADAYRQEAQKAILAYRDKVAKENAGKTPAEPPAPEPTAPVGGPEARKAEAERKQKELEAAFLPFLERSALDSWPTGEAAEQLRLASLHRLRDRELQREEMSRDYGELLRSYEKEAAEVRALSAESPLLATLETERKELRQQADALYPKALAIWQEGIYQTPFLETFLSNWPQGDNAPEMALALGNAYARSKREADSVEQYLRAAAAGPENPVGSKALLGLRNLAPHLQDLVALARLAESDLDPELRGLAQARLEKVAPTFAEVENGSAFVKEYGENPQVPAVRKRIEVLAQNLYGEVVLYQSLGDPVKALERIQKILEHAPLTPAAEALRQKALGKSGDA
jgi:predicted Zn-dependent protease